MEDIVWWRGAASAFREPEPVAAKIDLFVPLQAHGDPIEAMAENALGWARGSAGEVRVLRRALDARKGRSLGHRVSVLVARRGELLDQPRRSRPPAAWPPGRPLPRVVIIGSGPAGAWAALRLAEAGVVSTVLERGKAVQPRRKDLARLQRGVLVPDSNYCFGEGGAGTYSDGKLYTRSKDRDGVAAVLADLVRCGAPDDIAVEARPHVGSNLLPKVLTALRGGLEAAGVTYHFENEAVGLRVEAGRVRAVKLRGGDEIGADAVVLAVGHSARSVYEWLADAGVVLERKGFAVGVRMEHPQPLVDRLQYGSAAGHPALPPAFYELSAGTVGEAVGAYSFCMCPGGFIVPAATEPDGVVVNGMSLSARASAFANAGMVVPLTPADLGPSPGGALAGIAFARAIERAAFVAGGGMFRAPAVRLADFLARRTSSSLPKTSYHPGVVDADFASILPAFVIDALRRGLGQILARHRLLDHPDAVLVGVETRTSAPVRVLRRSDSLQSPSVAGLYPAGEGAGYAGGIVSAALDGVRIADAILRS